MVPEMISRSDMISTLPERLARGYTGRLRIVDPPLKIEGFTVAALWHERNHRDPAQRWLRELLWELAQKPVK